MPALSEPKSVQELASNARIIGDEFIGKDVKENGRGIP
jgi:hypothetical protein